MKNLANAYLLSAADGTHVDVRTDRGPWVFLIAHSADCAGCRDYADRLVGARSNFSEWGARLAVVLHSPLAAAQALHGQLDATVEVFADPEQSLPADAGSVLVTDEWGDIFHHAAGGAVRRHREQRRLARRLAVDAGDADELVDDVEARVVREGVGHHAGGEVVGQRDVLRAALGQRERDAEGHVQPRLVRIYISQSCVWRRR